MTIYRLTYVSTAEPSTRAADVDHILDAARRRNAKLAITGLLAYNGANFMQTLEGDRADVERVLASISRDPRHSGLIVIASETVPHRAFPEWAMEAISLRRLAPGSDQSNGFDEASRAQTLPDGLRVLYASFNSLAGPAPG